MVFLPLILISNIINQINKTVRRVPSSNLAPEHCTLGATGVRLMFGFLSKKSKFENLQEAKLECAAAITDYAATLSYHEMCDVFEHNMRVRFHPANAPRVERHLSAISDHLAENSDVN